MNNKVVSLSDYRKYKEQIKGIPDEKGGMLSFAKFMDMFPEVYKMKDFTEYHFKHRQIAQAWYDGCVDAMVLLNQPEEEVELLEEGNNFIVRVLNQ